MDSGPPWRGGEGALGGTLIPGLGGGGVHCLPAEVTARGISAKNGEKITILFYPLLAYERISFHLSSSHGLFSLFILKETGEHSWDPPPPRGHTASALSPCD